MIVDIRHDDNFNQHIFESKITSCIAIDDGVIDHMSNGDFEALLKTPKFRRMIKVDIINRIYDLLLDERTTDLNSEDVVFTNNIDKPYDIAFLYEVLHVKRAIIYNGKRYEGIVIKKNRYVDDMYNIHDNEDNLIFMANSFTEVMRFFNTYGECEEF